MHISKEIILSEVFEIIERKIENKTDFNKKEIKIIKIL